MRQQHQHQQHQPTLWTLSHAGTAKTILLTAVPVAINLKAPTNRPIPADPPKAEGSLWSLREEAKPTKPQLWKPASKSIAGLWRDAPAPDQPNQKLLWSQKAAKRTTEKTPERHEITYKPSNKLVVEVSGDMWRRRQEEQDGEKPAGWMSRCVKEVKRQVHKEHTWPDMIVRKGKLIVGSSPRQHLEEPAHQRPVLRRSHSSRTLLVETKEPEAHVKEVEVKIAGRLWTARTPAPAPPATETPKSPLWTPETASRTTTAIPERISTPVTPKKQNLDLPKVSGSLWNSQQPRDVAVKRGKVVIGSHLWGHAEPAQKPALRKSKSSVTIFAVEMTTGVRDETKVEVNVAGRLWTATMPRPEEPPLVPASPLWTKETAMRTTDAIPERVTPVPRKSSLDLPKLSGSLWNMQPRDVVVKKGKVVIGSHLWHHQSVQHAPVVRHSSSSRTLIPVAREEGERRNEVTVSVGGRLWTAKAPSPAPIAPAAPESPLWSKETARRTTDAIPERVAPVPRNTCADLPKAAGSLWDVRDVAVKKGKVVVSSGLWGQSAQPAQHSLPRRSHSSIVVVVGVEREASVVEKVEVKIGGRLWTAAMSHIPAPAPVIIDVPESPLWNKQTASRTTTAIPDRVVPAPRKMSIDLPKVHGSMWDKHLPRDVVVRKGKIVVAQNSLWSHHHHERAHAPVQRTSRSSRTIFVEPKRDEKIEKVELKVEVGGRLWSAPAPQTLPAIVADEPQSPMWTKEAAKRSTNALPERISPVVPKKIASLELPKAAGSLWDGRDIVVKKGKVVVSDNLWSKPEPIVKPVMQTSRSSRTVFAVEEEAEKVEKVEVKVGGRLWSASRSRAVSPAPIAAEAPKTPLWTPETASRTTAAIPERVVPAPRKMSVELPKATGSLWDRRSVVVRKGKVVVDGLWNHRPQTAVAHPIVKRSKSSLVVLGVKREEVEEVKEDKVGVKVGGRLWTATVPTAPVAKEDAPLWTAATAARTTLAAPVKTTPALRKESDHLPTVSGSLWSIEALQPQVKKGKIVLSTSLWSRHDQPHHAPVVRRSGSSRTLFVEPTSDEDIEKVEVKVAGRLWTASRNILPSVAVVSPDIQLWTAPPPPPPAEKPAELQLAVSEPLPRPKKQVADRSLPKAGGSLWGNRSITVKKGRIVVSENLWDHSQLAPRPVLRKTSSSRVLAVMPTEPEVQKPTWQVKVGGRLWNAEASTDVVPAISTPLWTKETAERTTSAIPERVATAPRKASIDLPKAEGSLWSGRDVTVKKGKVVVSNHLWCDHDSPVVAVRKARSSRVVVAVESREAEGVVEVNVAGRLWSALTPKNPTTTIVSNTPLWAPETASRTTTATPERVATTPRKMSLDLPKATGSLWDQQPQDVVVQKRKIIITPSGLWNERSHQHPVMRRSTSRLTLVPAPCHVKRKDVAIMVAGRLWTASRAPPPPPEHDSHDSQALWAPSAPAVVEEYEHDDAFSKYMSLPARDIVVKKTRGGAHSVVVSGGLWNHQPTTPAQERQIEITVAGRLWTAALPVAQPIERKLAAPLWTPPTAPDSTSEPVASQRLLWHRDTASRTTSAAPERGISVPRKMSVDLPKATGNLWSEAEEVPPLSRTSTVSGASSGDEDEEQTGTRGDVQCALRRMRSGRLWQPSAEVAGELEGRVIEINRKKGVVVVGQQRRDRYFSMTPQKREDVNPGFRENIRIGSLRGKLRVTAAERV